MWTFKRFKKVQSWVISKIRNILYIGFQTEYSNKILCSNKQHVCSTNTTLLPLLSVGSPWIFAHHLSPRRSWWYEYVTVNLHIFIKMSHFKASCNLSLCNLWRPIQCCGLHMNVATSTYTRLVTDMSMIT